MRRRQQLGEYFAIRLAVEIEHDAALVGVGVNEREAALRMFDIAGERRQQPIRIAARRLDLDHVSAKIGKPPRRVGGRNIAQLDDTEMTESGFVVDS